METYRYIDTHAHLSMLTHSPLKEILERAATANITKMVTVSTEQSNWQPCNDLAKANANLYSALGVHPHEAQHWAEWKPELEKWFLNNKPPEKCVAIGEAGLDLHYNLSPREEQIVCFEDQVKLAKDTDLPLIIHCRNAFPELYTSLKKVGLGKRSAVLHCFTGTYEEAKLGLDIGLKISFSGIVTFKKSEDLRRTAAKLPATSLVIETDCPYLAPMPHRGKPNEPSYLPETARVLAHVLNIPLKPFTEQLFQQSVDFFGL